MKTSIHGFHMDTCVWSNDAATEGIPTCVCHRISDYKKEALNIMNIYYILKKEGNSLNNVIKHVRNTKINE